MIYSMGLFCICGLFVVFRVTVSREFGYDVEWLRDGLVCSLWYPFEERKGMGERV